MLVLVAVVVVVVVGIIVVVFTGNGRRRVDLEGCLDEEDQAGCGGDHVGSWKWLWKCCH